MAFCTKCGAVLPDGAKFCGICGAQTGREQAQPMTQTSPMRRVRTYQQDTADTPQQQLQPQTQPRLRSPPPSRRSAAQPETPARP